VGIEKPYVKLLMQRYGALSSDKGGSGCGFLANERPVSESSWSHARHSMTAARRHIAVTVGDEGGCSIPGRVAPKRLMWRPSRRTVMLFHGDRLGQQCGG
jgi:hypothetical protein